jgi:hypothetical protein
VLFVGSVDGIPHVLVTGSWTGSCTVLFHSLVVKIVKTEIRKNNANLSYVVFGEVDR